MKAILLVSFLLSSCSWGYKKAFAPTNPPQIAKSQFDEQKLIGEYRAFGAPKMFLWPVFKENGQGKLVELSLPEQAAVRQKVSSLADRVAEFSALKLRAQFEIEKKYYEIILLENLYRENKCYSLCDEEEWLTCDITNECNLKNDTWKVAQDPAEQALIDECKENESQREMQNGEKEKEVSEKVDPLRLQEGQASLALLAEVERDFFAELTSFSFTYDPLREQKLLVSLVYGDVIYSLAPTEGSFPIRELNLDLANGYLSFKVDAVDLQNEKQVYGEIFFDLELSSVGDNLKVDGDVRLSYLDGRKERVGRFSSAGQVAKPGQVANNCQKD